MVCSSDLFSLAKLFFSNRYSLYTVRYENNNGNHTFFGAFVFLGIRKVLQLEVKTKVVTTISFGAREREKVCCVFSGASSWLAVMSTNVPYVVREYFTQMGIDREFWPSIYDVNQWIIIIKMPGTFTNTSHTWWIDFPAKTKVLHQAKHTKTYAWQRKKPIYALVVGSGGINRHNRIYCVFAKGL